VSKPSAHPSRLAAATVVRSDVGIILAKNLRNDDEDFCLLVEYDGERTA